MCRVRGSFQFSFPDFDSNFRFRFVRIPVSGFVSSGLDPLGSLEASCSLADSPGLSNRKQLSDYFVDVLQVISEFSSLESSR